MLAEQSKNLTLYKEVDFSYIVYVYQSKNGSWRGFVHPYDVTIEADSKEEALEALKEMAEVYKEGLEKHGNPKHLALKPLSDPEDNERFQKLALDVIADKHQITGTDFYAETVSA